ncbi:MAG: squalene synthase HpnC [Planctomycetota bacterium]|nr:MAG: squalene synthase HpnC [Planctomycetota bacterium]REK24199.1 MAG: squalene synthase HpnC [Planctomycetota bacterium]REK28813.1 MAG: squalene synthase HpnC [Planctomycetota bacterium]
MVVDELAVWGPDSAAVPRVDRPEAEAYCRKLARSHYENFPVVTWALPRRLHQHFYNVYAFCRWADDLGDEIGDPVRSLELLGWWREELAACYRDEPRHPVFVALRPTILRFEIPIDPFADLISAFEQDQSVHEYETFSQLRDYCRRSADPVGRIVLHLCERYNQRNAALSDSVCTGLQLANFWQDVDRDRDIGRTYLPREDRLRFGYTDEMLAAKETNNAFRSLMEYEVERAREFLRAGSPLVDVMPGRLRIDIELFIRGGLQILREIKRIDYRVWERRPTVSKSRFFTLLLQTSAATLSRRLLGRDGVQ